MSLALHPNDPPAPLSRGSEQITASRGRWAKIPSSIDEGVNNMFAIIKELVNQEYPRRIYPEHPRAFGYARAMMQAAMSS